MPGGNNKADKGGKGGKGGKDSSDAGPSSSSALATAAGAAGAPAAPPPATTPAEKAALLERIKAQLAAMGLRDVAGSAAERQTREAKARYAFWETQPVVQFGGASAGGEAAAASTQQQQNGGAEDDQGEDGPIDAPKTVADVKKEPYALAPGFEWSDLDTSDPAQIDELYHLLHHNYVEDDSEAFRFRYSPDFLRWALRPPGHRPEWSIGVRASAASTKQGEKPAATPPTEQGEEGKEADAGATSSTNPQNKKQKGKLLGFISAVPATMGVSGKTVAMVEINFLCVHKRLRSKRLAPLLIREVTRRVNLQGIWQAAYTAGVVLPVPLSEARYWHRPLHPRKLVDVGFSHLPPRATMKAYVKLHSLPAPGSTLSGLRPFDPAKDAAGVAALLGAYLETGAEGGGGGGGGSSSSPCRFRMAPVMCEGEVAHWLGPREGVVGTWVVERAVDDPEVLRMLAEEDGGALAAASSSWSPSAAAAAGEAAAPTEEDRRRARSQRAAARRAVAASREVALRQAAAATAEGGGGGGAAAASGGGGKGGGKKPPPKPTFVSDLLSFYTIASSVLSHPSHDELRAAYGFYSVPGTHPPKHLLKEALCLAAASGHDVFNLLELADGADRAALKELKFGPGDGQLRYYLYNWRAKGAPFAPADVGLVLL